MNGKKKKKIKGGFNVKYKITCCSTADLSEQYLSKRGIPYIPFHFQIDGEDYLDDLGKSIPPKEFYERIEKGAMPVTSQVNAEEYKDFFKAFLEDGYDVLHISLSSGISGTYNSAQIAREELKEEYPERRIVVIDSLAASSGYGMLVDALVDKKAEGMLFEDMVQWVEQHKLEVNHWFYSSDLTHFKRGGRISPAAATFGNILNICPILDINFEGKLIPRKKVRGKKVMRELVDIMETCAQGGVQYSGKCFISHSAKYEEAKLIADMIEERFPNLNGNVEIFDIGAVIGAHTGPGTVALFFFGNRREKENK